MKIGIVGAGHITTNAHLPVLRAMPDVQVAWICDADAESGRRVATACRLPFVDGTEPETLPDCDAVLLAIPVTARRRYLQALAGRNIAVLAEKPFALTTAEHLEYCSWFAPHRLGCGYQRRTYATVNLLRKLVAQGSLGRLLRVVAAEGSRTTRTGTSSAFLRDATRHHGVLADLGVHALDLVLFVTGVQEIEVLETSTVMDDGVDRRFSGRVLLAAAPGTVEFEFCFSWLDPQPNAITWHFEHAEVRIPTAASTQAELLNGKVVVANFDLVGDGATTVNQAFFLEWAQFLAGARTKAASIVQAVSAVSTTRALDTLLAYEVES